ncbi:hypothetical protein [Erythrobacter colymbi]|uniref:hypothetical protein n=1 Tax=Erythrobacter colymbi TaxID=1161202 RepID=UPI000A3B05DB|nr:hypothetical protein [Erythrobacter colymbi]
MFWNRVAKKPVEPAIDEAEEQRAAQASQRLGRLVSRQRDESEQLAAAQTPDAAALAATFADCAFLVLAVPLEATAADIRRAFDDLSFDEDADSEALSRAQAALLSPRDRLTHELAWLPGCDPAAQARACAAIRQGDCDAVDALRFAASGVARLNLACALLAARPRDPAVLVGLLTDMGRWDTATTTAAIAASRSAAGVRAADPEHIEIALHERQSAIATAIAEAAAATREGRQALTRTIEAGGASGLALEAVVSAYARIIDPQVQGLQQRMTDAVASLKANASQPAVLTGIVTTLDLWSQLRLPLQKLEAARGLDDPASASLFRTLRDIGIDLANQHGLQTETLRLMRALKQAFVHVPGVQPMIQKDLPVIIGNVCMAQLEKLVEDTVRNIHPFAAEVRDHGFGGGQRTGRLIDCFEQFHEAAPEEEAPFILLRHTAIELNNKCAAPSLALVIIEWLLDHRVPEPVNSRLVQDMCQLQRNINQRR